MSDKNNNFEAKLEDAKKTLQTLMKPEITLQESVKAYEKGIEELKEAQKILEDAQIKIDEIRAK